VNPGAEPQLRTLQHSARFGREGPLLCAPLRFTPGAYPIALALAQHLDPTFQPPDTLLREDSQFTSAAGCGGGREVEQRGTPEQGLLWDDYITEHAADESSHGAWTPYGLAAGCALSVGRYERFSGYYELTVTGPAPQVDEVHAAWCALIERGTGVTAQHARDALSRAAASRLVTLTHTHPIRPEGPLLGAPLSFAYGVYPIVRLLAQHLDPSYDPPDTVLFKESDYTSANGCGGGQFFEKRGDDQRWLTWNDMITEHSASDTSDGSWEVFGLAGGCQFAVGRDDGERTYDLRVTAPAQLAREVMAVWTALVEREPHVTVEVARAEMARVVGLRAPA